MIDDLGWRELLLRWSVEAVAHQDVLATALSAEAVASGWLGHAPATAEQIEQAEARLGRRLPPSLREFYLITNGWPATSFDFGSIVAVQDLGWYADRDPKSFKNWTDSMDEIQDPDAPDSYRSILSRSVLVSDGTDQMLLDVGTGGADAEWASRSLTSWNPGLEDGGPTFRAGLQGHYATFVHFDVPESPTHSAVADAVDSIYRRLLHGDVGAAADLDLAPRYGSQRALALIAQLKALHGHYRSWLNLPLLTGFADNDPAFEQDLWPMYVAGVLSRGESRQSGLNRVLQNAPPATAALINDLAAGHRHDGGLRATYSGPFGAAVEAVRALVRAKRLTEAWDAYLGVLPLWQPLSPQHLAPLALVWDIDLARLFTRDRGIQILQTPRAQ